MRTSSNVRVIRCNWKRTRARPAKSRADIDSSWAIGPTALLAMSWTNLNVASDSLESSPSASDSAANCFAPGCGALTILDDGFVAIIYM